MSTYSLKIPYEEYEKKMLKKIEEGELILKSLDKFPIDIDRIKEKIRLWERASIRVLDRSFEDFGNDLIRVFDFYDEETRYRFKDLDIEKEIYITTKDFSKKVSLLKMTLMYSSVSDLIRSPDQDLDYRKLLTVEEKKILILSKLKEINNGEYYSLKMLLALNNISIKYDDEIRELALNFRKSNHIQLIDEYSNSKIRITTEGLSYLEKKNKPISEKKTKKEIDDYNTICRKIDDVLNRLEKMELKTAVGQEIIFEEISELKWTCR